MEEKKCNVNFLWYSDKESLSDDIIEKILLWRGDDNTNLVFWHNSKHEIKPHESIEFVHLNSLGELYKQIHKNDMMALYFKVDLFKLCISHNSLSTNKDKYFVYTDLDIKPMNYNELFDEKTIKQLDFYNFVYADGGFSGYENSFMIMKYNDKLILALENIIKYNCRYTLSNRDNDQMVFQSFKIFILYYYKIQGWIEHEWIERIIFSNRDPYSFVRSELKILNVNLLNFEKRYDINGLIIDRKFMFCEYNIPTKLISGPESRFGGKLTNPDIITPVNFNDKVKEFKYLHELLYVSLVNFGVDNLYRKAAFKILKEIKSEDLLKILISKGSLGQFNKTPLDAFKENKNFGYVMTTIMINNILNKNILDENIFIEDFKNTLNEMLFYDEKKFKKDGKSKRKSKSKSKRKSKSKSKRKSKSKSKRKSKSKSKRKI